MTIKPHGGKLIDLVCKPEEKEELLAKANNLPKSKLSEREIADFELLATGVYSPLEGFMTQNTYNSVLETMHLPNGLPWTLPIVHAVTREFAANIKDGDQVALTSEDGDVLGILTVLEQYVPDRINECEKVYLTSDEAHPGVAYTLGTPEVYLAGPIVAMELPKHDEIISNSLLTPKETRTFFKMQGFERVVAFQTRNPIHRAHEYLLKVAAESVDCVWIHPLVGATKKGDIPADVRMACYKVITDKYFPEGRAYISGFPAAMRYAGPKEAIFHAICRKNYGCTHFIVGRDHAGVGDYYGTYDAQKIFSEFDKAAIDITPMFFEHTFYSKGLGHLASDKTCHIKAEGDRVFLSGTKVRELLSKGEALPEEFTRPEISEILVEAYKTTEF